MSTSPGLAQHEIGHILTAWRHNGGRKNTRIEIAADHDKGFTVRTPGHRTIEESFQAMVSGCVAERLFFFNYSDEAAAQYLQRVGALAFLNTPWGGADRAQLKVLTDDLLTIAIFAVLTPMAAELKALDPSIVEGLDDVLHALRPGERIQIADLRCCAPAKLRSET